MGTEVFLPRRRRLSFRCWNTADMHTVQEYGHIFRTVNRSSAPIPVGKTVAPSVIDSKRRTDHPLIYTISARPVETDGTRTIGAIGPNSMGATHLTKIVRTGLRTNTNCLTLVYLWPDIRPRSARLRFRMVRVTQGMALVILKER